MKRITFFIIAFFILHLSLSPAHAQEGVERLEWLTVDLWPDYDRPSVLVLLTGSLPDEAPLPAEVTIPLPEQATINAVARVSDQNEMIDDIDFTVGDDSLTLVTPDRRFRVEYYHPYERDGLQRQFQFNWEATLSVGEMDLSVQEPLAATTLSTTPETESVLEGEDGLQYYNLPVRTVAAAESYTVEVAYTMGRGQLTVAAAQAATGDGDPAPDVAQPDGIEGGGGAGINWPIVLAVAGGVLVIMAVGWQLFGQRLTIGGRKVPRKPRPARAEKSGTVRFCHNCGTQVQPGDRFCRECGTPLKAA